MGSTLRKLKREKKPASPIDPRLIQAWNKGFAAGAKEQMKQDTEIMMEWLGRLEEIEGIGPKMAWKIREHLLNFLSERMKKNGD
jgi:hypothetical protein